MEGLILILLNILIVGCPLTQTIQDNSTASATGEGLFKGVEDKTSTFFVDTQGRRGDLSVSVEGPNSVAKVQKTIIDLVNFF